MQRTIASVLLGILVVYVAYSWFSAAVVADETGDMPGQSEFAGKVVTVYLHDPLDGSGVILTDVTIIDIAGRFILVGNGADSGREEDWTRDVRAGIPWENVTAYFAMTPEQFEKKIKEQRERDCTEESVGQKS